MMLNKWTSFPVILLSSLDSQKIVDAIIVSHLTNQCGFHSFGKFPQCVLTFPNECKLHWFVGCERIIAPKLCCHVIGHHPLNTYPSCPTGISVESTPFWRKGSTLPSMKTSNWTYSCKKWVWNFNIVYIS